METKMWLIPFFSFPCTDRWKSTKGFVFVSIEWRSQDEDGSWYISAKRRVITVTNERIPYLLHSAGRSSSGKSRCTPLSPLLHMHGNNRIHCSAYNVQN